MAEVGLGSPLISDVESQKKSGDAGKGLGIAMFVLLIIALIFCWFPVIPLICLVAVIIIASSILCQICCAYDYNLEHKVKRWSNATLLTTVLMLVFWIIVIALATKAHVQAFKGAVTQNTLVGASTGIVVLAILMWLLNVLGIIFSGLFVWSRDGGCCGR